MNASSWIPLNMSETEPTVTLTTKPVPPIFPISLGSTIFLLGQARILEVILLLNNATTNIYKSYFSLMFYSTLLKISRIHPLQSYNCLSSSPPHLVYSTTIKSSPVSQPWILANSHFTPTHHITTIIICLKWNSDYSVFFKPTWSPTGLFSNKHSTDKG